MTCGPGDGGPTDGNARAATADRGRGVAPDGGTDADATVTVGAAGGDAALPDHPASPAAYAAARELAPGAADPTLALAGVLAAGVGVDHFVSGTSLWPGCVFPTGIGVV